MRKPRLQLMMLFKCSAAALISAGCTPTGSKAAQFNDRAEPQPEAMTATSLELAGLHDLDLGQNWDATADQPRVRAGSAAHLPRPSGSLTSSDQEVPPTSVWVVVLGTVTRALGPWGW